jgi:hypothetical protein
MDGEVRMLLHDFAAVDEHPQSPNANIKPGLKSVRIIHTKVVFA